MKKNHFKNRNVRQFFFSFFLFVSSWVIAGNNDAIDTITKLGFSPVHLTPMDFELNSLSGVKKRLSDYKGKWIWLNFWATWCGPCRMEMPTLESLHQEYKNENLQILGVSVDQGNAQSVLKYIKKQGISFPILHDFAGNVSNLYQASSIPSIYLISPDWKLVGVFRGGKSWDRSPTLKLVKTLLEVKKIPDNFADQSKNRIGKKANTREIELPNNLSPPQMTFRAPQLAELKTQNEYVFDVAIEWPQNSREYLIKLPKLEFKKDLMDLISISSSAISQKSLLYKFKLKPLKEGMIHVGPITLSYRPKAGGKELFVRHQGLDVKIVKKSIFSNKLGLGIICVFIFLSIVFLYLKLQRFKKSKVGFDKTIFDQDKIIEELHFAQRLKIEGKDLEFAKALLNLHKLLSSKGHFDSIPDTDILLEQIKYSGIYISKEKLKIYENDIKTLLKTEDD